MKNLETQLSAARMSFAMFERLPPENQRQLLESAPRIVGEAARRAAQSGHAAEAKEMLEAAGRDVPKGATEGQWREIIDAGMSSLA